MRTLLFLLFFVGLAAVTAVTYTAVQSARTPQNGKLVYKSRERLGNRREVYLIGEDGTGNERVTYNDANESWSEWSPDGQFLAIGTCMGQPPFCRDGEIEVVNTTTNERLELAGEGVLWLSNTSLAVFADSFVYAVPLPVTDLENCIQVRRCPVVSLDARINGGWEGDHGAVMVLAGNHLFEIRFPATSRLVTSEFLAPPWVFRGLIWEYGEDEVLVLASKLGDRAVFRCNRDGSAMRLSDLRQREIPFAFRATDEIEFHASYGSMLLAIFGDGTVAVIGLRSPDRTKVAFQDGQGQIFVGNADGTERRKVADGRLWGWQSVGRGRTDPSPFWESDNAANPGSRLVDQTVDSRTTPPEQNRGGTTQGDKSSLVVGDSRGEGDVHLVMRFEVVDPEDGMPIPNAEVSLEDVDGRQLANVWTDRHGVAVILFRQSSDLASVSAIRVRAPRREEWHLQQDVGDIEWDAKSVGLWVPQESSNWTGAYEIRTGVQLPTDRAVIEAVRSRRYTRSADVAPPPGVDYEHYTYVRPARPYQLWNSAVELRRLGRPYPGDHFASRDSEAAAVPGQPRSPRAQELPPPPAHPAPAARPPSADTTLPARVPFSCAPRGDYPEVLDTQLQQVAEFMARRGAPAVVRSTCGEVTRSIPETTAVHLAAGKEYILASACVSDHMAQCELGLEVVDARAQLLASASPGSDDVLPLFLTLVPRVTGPHELRVTGGWCKWACQYAVALFEFPGDDRWLGSVESRIEELAEGATPSESARAVLPMRIAYLEEGSYHSVATLSGNTGRSYVVVGLCDRNCRQIRLKVWNPTENVVAESAGTRPVVRFTAAAAGGYFVYVDMGRCSDSPCRYAVGLYELSDIGEAGNAPPDSGLAAASSHSVMLSAERLE